MAKIAIREVSAKKFLKLPSIAAIICNEHFCHSSTCIQLRAMTLASGKILCAARALCTPPITGFLENLLTPAIFNNCLYV